ncbi:MAG: DUF4440 domain-containing protein [Geodermatophilaceae bacterium]
MIADDIRLVIGHELQLQSFEVRASAARVEDLLDPEFREIGASGRLWTRSEIIRALADEVPDGQAAIEATEMESLVVGPDLVLLTYVSKRHVRRARRSSLWRHSGLGWRLLHHQGTLLPDA